MYQQIRIPLICSFAGIAAVILAFTNEEGLVIQETIELGPTGATIFYWSSAVFFFSIVAITGRRAWKSLVPGKRAMQSS